MIIVQLYTLILSIFGCLLPAIYGNINVAEQLMSFKNQFLPMEYRNTNFTTDDLQRLFHTKCKKASNSFQNLELYQEIERGAIELGACFNHLFNITSMQEEINHSLPIGQLDAIFHKYCAKLPQLEKCFRDFNKIIQSCLTENEQSKNSVMVHLASSLLDFLCIKGGNYLAVFVAEDGPRCFQKNKEHIVECANASFSELLMTNSSQFQLIDLYTLPELLLQPEHCNSLNDFEVCTVYYLKQCSQVTPANIAESIFDYIKNGTNCKVRTANNCTPQNLKWRQTSSASNLVSIRPLHRVLPFMFVTTILYIFQYLLYTV